MMLFMCSILLVKAQTPLDWHLLSPAKDQVYGAGILEAYRKLDNRTPQRKVTVALIDAGFDLEHEALANRWWNNKKEMPANGKDDDKNGYKDDLHGWNFLASADGRLIEYTSEEAFRQFLKVKGRFDELHGKKRNAEEDSEYLGYLELAKNSSLASSYMGSCISHSVGRSVEDLNRMLLEKCSDREPTLADLGALLPDVQQSGDTILKIAFYTYNMVWGFGGNKKWDDLYRNRYTSSQQQRENYEKAVSALVDERNLAGDDFHDLSDKKYGNHEFLSVAADEGTAVAGIIAATPGVMKGIRGITDQAELMVIRAFPSAGDAYDKDVALAIRYAVEQGADIIYIGSGKYVLDNRKWIEDAVAYAEKHKVLIVHAAGDDCRDTDEAPYFPSKQRQARKADFSNILTVGASDVTGNPYINSNYGAGSVDVFAPGVELYAAVRGDNYKKSTGTAVAASVVTGIAAMLKSYYPKLGASQIKDILVRTAQQASAETIVFPHDPTNSGGAPIGRYDKLCLSGGIVDAVAAFELAREMYEKK